MKWLLSLLGLTNKKSTTTNSTSEDNSFLKIKQTPGALHCQWQLREETKAMIDRGFGSKLFIRIRDISGDQSIASKTIEVRSSQTEASIDLPAAAGKILVDLGYRYDDDFISLEYQILNFGEKIHPSTALHRLVHPGITQHSSRDVRPCLHRQVLGWIRNGARTFLALVMPSKDATNKKRRRIVERFRPPRRRTLHTTL